MPRTIRTIPPALCALLLLALPAAASAKKSPSSAKAKQTPAKAADRNHDGLPDSWEKKYKLSLKVNQARLDPDKDGAVNSAEYAAGTNPRKADTNNNGIPDGTENVGTVTSFDATSGLLKITNAKGDPISATVTSRTHVDCVTAPATTPTTPPVATRSDRGHRPHGDGPGSNPAPGASNGQAPPVNSGEDNEPASPSYDGGYDEVACDTSALVAGAVVHRAGLRLTVTGNEWSRLEIVVAAPAPTPTPTPATARRN